MPQAVPTNGAYQPQGTSSNKALVILAIVLGLCLAAALGAMGFMLFNMQQQQQTSAPAANTTNTADTKQDDSKKDASQQAPLSISCNPNKPFWGVWVYQSDDKADAENKAACYSAKGYAAIALDTRTIPDAHLSKKWAVTVGTWKDQAATAPVIQALAKDGYGSFSSSYTGDIKAPTSQSTVTLQCERPNGTSVSGEVHRDAEGYVIADSDTHEYTMDELMAKNLTPAELCIAWNEPFARQGYVFTNVGIQEYFERNCPWYKRQDTKVVLTGISAKNNELFKEFAKEHSEYSVWLYLKV